MLPFRTEVKSQRTVACELARCSMRPANGKFQKILERNLPYYKVLEAGKWWTNEQMNEWSGKLKPRKGQVKFSEPHPKLMAWIRISYRYLISIITLILFQKGITFIPKIKVRLSTFNKGFLPVNKGLCWWSHLILYVLHKVWTQRGAQFYPFV